MTAPMTPAAATARDFLATYPDGEAYLAALEAAGLDADEFPALEPLDVVLPELIARAARAGKKREDFVADIVGWPDGASLDHVARELKLNLRGKDIPYAELEAVALEHNGAVRDAAYAEVDAYNTAIGIAMTGGDYVVSPYVHLPGTVERLAAGREDAIFHAEASELRGWKLSVVLDSHRYGFYQDAMRSRVDASNARYDALQAFIDGYGQ